MRKFILLPTTFMLSAALTMQAQKIKITVQKGQKYKLETSSLSTSTFEASRENFESSFSSVRTTVYEITAVTKDEISLTATITRIRSVSQLMGQESIFDSDKKDNDPATEPLSKLIGKSKNIVVNNKGKVIKEDGPEKNEATDMAWLYSRPETELFTPVLIGRELKPGNSFPVADSFTKEKQGTTFSFKKEKVTILDSGIYTINAIENGMANISYSGNQLLTILMNMNGSLVSSQTNSIVRYEIGMDIQTGVVISKKVTEESVLTAGTGDGASPGTSKNVVTTKVTLLQ